MQNCRRAILGETPWNLIGPDVLNSLTFRRVGGHDLAGDQPIEEHAYSRELLLDRRCRGLCLQLLYIGGDVMRPDGGECQAALLAPGRDRTVPKILKIAPRRGLEAGYMLYGSARLQLDGSSSVASGKTSPNPQV
jgi:hypothetical protein